MSPQEGSALAGVRVLDLSSVVMGPACTQVLAAYGADVLKVEPPAGDIMRHAGASREPGMGAMFIHANRGKRSVVIDLKQDGGIDVLRRLLPRFDVLVHNVRPEAMARLGLDYDSVRRLREDIVYAELVGYGPGGRHAGRPAFDDVIQAHAGIAGLFALQDGGEPRYLPGLIADRMTGITAAHRILAALYRRRVTGKGSHVTVAMFETMAAFTLADHLGGRSFEPPEGPVGYSRLLTRFRKPYRTQDGHIAVLVYNDKHWRTFFQLIGREDTFNADARFQTAAERARNYDFIYGYLAEVLLTRPRVEWLEILEQADIPCAPVNTVDELIDDPHLNDVGFFSMRQSASGLERELGSGADMPSSPSPTLGQHTLSVLEEEGFNAAEIAALGQAGVIG